MELITQAEFARRANLSKTAIAKAVKSHKLDLIGEGKSKKIDFDSHKAQVYLKDNPTNRQVARRDKEGSESKQETVNNPSPDPEESILLRDEKTRIQTKKLRMELAEKMGELIVKKDVEDLFSKLNTAIIDYMFPLGDRLSPNIAGVFESIDQDKVIECKALIDKEVGRALEEIKRSLKDIL